MDNFRFSEYTYNMYLNKKSKIWTYFNRLRIKKILSLFKKYHKFTSVLEFGSYDLYFITKVYNIMKKYGCKTYDFTDYYDDKKEIYEIAKNNLKQLKEKEIKFSLINSTGEEINKVLNKKYDSIFIFETLEHVFDERKVIENIKYLSKKGTYVFVSVPLEFGIFFI